MGETKDHIHQPQPQPQPQPLPLSHPQSSPSLFHATRHPSWSGSVDGHPSPVQMHSRKRSSDHLPPEPHVSRKGRACLACRKLKVKCDSLERGDAGCSRCLRLGLDCITSKRMRVSLEDDGENAHPSIVRLDRAVEDILARLKMPPLESYLRTHPSQHQGPHSQHVEPKTQAYPAEALESDKQSYPTGALGSSSQPYEIRLDTNRQHAQTNALESTTQKSQSNPLESNAQTTRENSREPNAEDAHEMAPAPMGSLFEVTQLNTLRSRLKYGDPARRNSRKNMEHDLISMGVITAEEAEDMFSLFKTSLSRYLFDATIHESRSLLSVRESSTLFFTAIITVTSLHIPGKERVHATAHKHLRDLIATSFFDRFHTLEDIRALCIAAFWLPDLSWKLSGHCVRMATELNLHQAFYKALYSQKQSHADREHAFERARLWYLLYVLDHHFSIAYGRPPVTTELQAIKEYDVFLNAPECTPSDRRVLSQVTLFIILSRAYNHFGLEAERLMDGDDVTLLTHQRFIEDLDRWRYQFRHALNRDAHVGDYPAVGVELHYYFASMMLNSLALRGRSLVTISSTSTLPTSLRPLASHAISSAHQILVIVLEEPSIRDSMVGVPLYLHTVIAFAVVFLIKMSSRWMGIGVTIDPEIKTKPLIEGVIALFRSCRAGKGHILYAMADGFERLLRRNLGPNNNKNNNNGIQNGLDVYAHDARNGGGGGGYMGPHQQHQQQQQQDEEGKYALGTSLPQLPQSRPQAHHHVTDIYVLPGQHGSAAPQAQTGSAFAAQSSPTNGNEPMGARVGGTSTYDPYTGAAVSVSSQSLSHSQQHPQPQENNTAVAAGSLSGPGSAAGSGPGSYGGWQTEDDMLWSMGMGYDLLAMAPDLNAQYHTAQLDEHWY